MPQSLDDLIAQLDRLLAHLAEAEVEFRTQIEAVAPVHRAGAVNLVHYCAMRRQDVRALQSDLADLGATALSTAEANVHAKVLAARNVLAALRGDPGPWGLARINRAIDHGDEILAANAMALFGEARPGRPTRIMVTLPAEAAEQPDLVSTFVEAGMDIARINCAHDGPEAWARMAANVHASALAHGRVVQVSMDLPGPKLRTGEIALGAPLGDPG